MQRLASDLANPHFSGTESSEIFTSFRTDICIQLHHHPSHGDASDADVEETSGSFDAHLFLQEK